MSRDWFLPLVPVYGGLVAAKNAAYDRRLIQPKRLRWPVISVGNLSVGGSGKTPLVIRLAELLSKQGIAVDVLSRGYGRRSQATERVDPAGTAEGFGDEPLLIARRTAVPVFVGGSRYEAGLPAEKQLQAGAWAVHLLDDGFQHRKLARAADIVVVHSSDFAQTLLPAGRLREPLRGLRRASVVVLREEDAGLESEIRRIGVTAPVWFMQRYLEPLPRAGRCFAFCGIARPEEFFSSLRSLGMEVVDMKAFRDHHRYTREDMQRLAQMASESHVDAVVTTEKDEVKLDTGLRNILERAAPIRVAKLSVALRDEVSVVRQLLAHAKLAIGG